MIDPSNPTQQELIALLQQGREAWNTWRSEHLELKLDFSGYDFSVLEPYQIRFGGMLLGDNVNFVSAKFGDIVDFAGTRFGSNCDFHRAIFGNDINFRGATFGNKTNFSSVVFSNDIDFRGATFGSNIDFSDATFGYYIEFRSVIFENDIDFTDATFGKKIIFKDATFGDSINFNDATFGNYTEFSNTTFGSNIDFSYTYFGSKIDFTNVAFVTGINFTHVIFGDEIEFKEAMFGNDVCFGEAKFGNKTDFSDVTFGSKINFNQVSFLGDLSLRGMNYGKSISFDGISIDGPTDWKENNLSNISIRDVDFKHVNMEGAIFDGANMLGAQNLTLDSTSIRNTRFDDNAKDHWSVLRRIYTGPNMIVTLLFLIAFSLPYVSKVGFWVTVNKSQHHVENTTAEMRQSVEDTARRFKIPQSQIDELLPSPQQIKNRSLCLNDECRDIRLWKLLVGLDKGVGVMLFVIGLILFNALKGLITVMVIPMREQEERTGYSPSYKTSLKVFGSDSFKESIKEAIGSKTPLSNLWKLWTNVNIRWGYAPFYQMHRIVKILFWFSTVAFLWNAFHWLSRTIWIPA